MRGLSILSRGAWSIPSTAIPAAPKRRWARSPGMEPAKTIIEMCGGVEKVAEITGRDVSRVHRWMYPADRGGSDGIIPDGPVRKLLKHAAVAGIPLTPKDLFLSSRSSACTPSSQGVR